MGDHARLAAESPDATDEIKVHAGHVQIAGENTRQRAAEIRDHALAIIQAKAAADARRDMQRILVLAQQTLNGVDVNGDEQVAPIPSEGGVLTAYQHAQLMAVIPLTAAGATQPLPAATPAAPAPTVAPAHVHPTAPPAASKPAAAATTAPAAAKPAPAAGQVEVTIGDFSFAPREVRVPVGTTVVWVNQGQAPHTVTADDGSFDSQTLRNGQRFSHTFTRAGTFAYACEFHGGPGGVGMAGIIRVE